MLFIADIAELLSMAVFPKNEGCWRLAGVIPPIPFRIVRRLGRLRGRSVLRLAGTTSTWSLSETSTVLGFLDFLDFLDFLGIC